MHLHPSANPTAAGLQEAVKEFERNLSDMVGAFIEKVQGYFSQCRDLENQHHERMLEISMITLEKAIKNELDEDVSEDLRMVSQSQNEGNRFVVV